jgi:hypothetical protein
LTKNAYALLRGTMRGRLHVMTERPETLAVGSNVLAGTDPVKIQECTSLMIQTFEKFDQNAALKWANPFGNGTTGARVVSTLPTVNPKDYQYTEIYCSYPIVIRSYVIYIKAHPLLLRRVVRRGTTTRLFLVFGVGEHDGSNTYDAAGKSQERTDTRKLASAQR